MMLTTSYDYKQINRCIKAAYIEVYKMIFFSSSIFLNCFFRLAAALLPPLTKSNCSEELKIYHGVGDDRLRKSSGTQQRGPPNLSNSVSLGVVHATGAARPAELMRPTALLLNEAHQETANRHRSCCHWHIILRHRVREKAIMTLGGGFCGEAIVKENFESCLDKKRSRAIKAREKSWSVFIA